MEFKPRMVFLLWGWQKEADTALHLKYAAWLRKQPGCEQVESVSFLLKDPTDHQMIFLRARDAVRSYLEREHHKNGVAPQLLFHLSPGAPAMHATWLLLGKAVFPDATLLKSTLDAAGKWAAVKAEIPFEIRLERTAQRDGREAQLDKLLAAAPQTRGKFDEMPAVFPGDAASRGAGAQRGPPRPGAAAAGRRAGHRQGPHRPLHSGRKSARESRLQRSTCWPPTASPAKDLVPLQRVLKQAAEVETNDPAPAIPVH